jgi:hypothetical protein
MNLNGKINCATADAKKYQSEYYSKFKEYFDGIEEFRIVRNDILHGKGDFPNEPDLSVYRVLSIKESENGSERLAYTEYTDAIIQSYLERFSNINSGLSILWIIFYQNQGGKNQPLAYTSQ